MHGPSRWCRRAAYAMEPGSITINGEAKALLNGPRRFGRLIWSNDFLAVQSALALSASVVNESAKNSSAGKPARAL